LAAVVLAREGGNYRVLVDGVERLAVLRGKARQAVDRAVAGDRVRIDPATLADETLAIDGVEARRSLLARRTPAGRGQRPIAANVDQVLIVTATANPDPILQLIDRLLVVAEANELPALLIANKVDLHPATALSDHLAAAGYPVLAVSARSGAGVDDLARALVGRESVFTGPSGAGKSSLLNAIEPDLGLRVGALSRKVQRGVHTTTTATMIPLVAGGYVVDTPGFSDVGVWDVHPEGLAECYPEFGALIDRCRFADCRHRAEPGCAVRQAAEAGSVPLTRYRSYLAILTELEVAPEAWE
jgi:ribosome biogenesis GTPase